MLSKASEKQAVRGNNYIGILAGMAIGAIGPLMLYKFDYVFAMDSAAKFIAVNVFIAALSSSFFYVRYRDFMAPHVLIPAFYMIIVLSSAALEGAVSDYALKKVYWAVTLGILFFALGGLASFFFGARQAQRGGMLDMDLDRFRTFTLALWVVPVLAILYTFAVGGVPLLSANPEVARFESMKSVGGYINNLYILLIPASMMLVILYRLGRISFKTLLFCIFVSLSLYLLIGFRSRILYVLIAVFLAAYYYKTAILKERVPFLKTFSRGLAVLVVFAVSFTLLGYYRLKLSGEVWDYLPGHMPLWGLAIFMFLAYLRSLTVVMGRTIELAETEGFLYGQSYIDMLLSPLPGYSPQLLDEFIKEKLFPAGFTGGGSPPMAIGEAYINFGLPGVAITMFACGLFLALMHRCLLRNGTVSGLVLFSYFFQFILISGIFSGLLMFFQYVLSAVAVAAIVMLSRSEGNSLTDQRTTVF